MGVQRAGEGYIFPLLMYNPRRFRHNVFFSSSFATQKGDQLGLERQSCVLQGACRGGRRLRWQSPTRVFWRFTIPSRRNDGINTPFLLSRHIIVALGGLRIWEGRGQENRIKQELLGRRKRMGWGSSFSDGASWYIMRTLLWPGRVPWMGGAGGDLAASRNSTPIFSRVCPAASKRKVQLLPPY